MSKKLVFILCVIYSLNSYAVNVHWGKIKTTTCESGDDIIVPTDEPTPQIGYHFVGWKMGLKQLEYLGGNNAGYIDTLYTVNQNTSIKTKIQMLNVADNKSFSFGGPQGFGFELYPWDRKLEFNYNGLHWGAKISNNDIIEIDWTPNSIQYNINDIIQPNIGLPGGFKDTGSLWLFTLRRANQPSNIRIFYFQIYNNNILVRDFIPALDENNTPCLFDKVSKTFFYNLGQGDFIAGQKLNTETGISLGNIHEPDETITNACDSDLADLYFYPVYEPNTITLNWDYKDETGRTEQTQCVYDTPITDIPETPVRAGYKFMGWRVKESE